MPAAAPEVIVEPDDEAPGDCVELVPFAGTDALGNKPVLEGATEPDPTGDVLDVEVVSPVTELDVVGTTAGSVLVVVGTAGVTEVVVIGTPSVNALVVVEINAVVGARSAMMEIEDALMCRRTGKIKRTVSSESDRPWKRG
jgi:hypothetical protein